MAIDYGKVESNKDAQYSKGYYGAFTSWLENHKEEFERAIQAQLEYESSRDKSSTKIEVGTCNGSDPKTHKVYIKVKDLDSSINTMYVSPAIIFEWFTDNSGRHTKDIAELNKEFTWYLNKFLDFFDEIGLKYQQLNEVDFNNYKVNDQYEWIIKFLLPIN